VVTVWKTLELRARRKEPLAFDPATSQTGGMDAQQIEAAYLAFADALRSGGFLVPAQGWDASLIAAHIATNNDLISSAAEQIADGGVASYDNTGVIDDAMLRTVVAATGDLGDLARLVTTSAVRLASAWERLGPGRGAVEVPARIADGGRLVSDGPVPIRAFIEGNATFHLQRHTDQLNALRP
jgi:hypothetical protein